jgi:hypothetical protein
LEAGTNFECTSAESLGRAKPRTRLGRNVKIPNRLIAEMNAAANGYEIKFTPAKENYYAVMKELGELGLIGAGIGGGFINMSELHVMK